MSIGYIHTVSETLILHTLYRIYPVLHTVMQRMVYRGLNNLGLPTLGCMPGLHDNLDNLDRIAWIV